MKRGEKAPNGTIVTMYRFYNIKDWNLIFSLWVSAPDIFLTLLLLIISFFISSLSFKEEYIGYL